MKRIAMLAACVVTSTTWAADVITTEGGDTVRGAVTGGGDGTIVVKTDYAGNVSVKVAKIARLQTETNLKIKLKDGQILKGKLHADARDKAKMVAGTVTTDGFGLADIEAINTPPAKIQGFIQAGGHVQDGTQNVQQGTLGLQIARKTERDKIELRSLFNYAETNGTVTTRNGFGAIKYDYFLKSRGYWYASSEANADAFKDLGLRTVTGAGLGLKLLKGPKVNLRTEAGVAFLAEDFEVNSAQDDRRLTARISAQVSWKATKQITVANSALAYPALEGSSQIQGRNELSVDWKLNARWSVRAGHVYTFNSDPPPGVEKDDDLYLVTVRLSF